MLWFKFVIVRSGTVLEVFDVDGAVFARSGGFQLGYEGCSVSDCWHRLPGEFSKSRHPIPEGRRFVRGGATWDGARPISERRDAYTAFPGVALDAVEGAKAIEEARLEGLPRIIALLSDAVI